MDFLAILAYESLYHSQGGATPVTRLWPMCIMVPMGRVQMICDFRSYNYWTGNAIGFRASRELCSNFLFNVGVDSSTGSAENKLLDLAAGWHVQTYIMYLEVNCQPAFRRWRTKK